MKSLIPDKKACITTVALILLCLFASSGAVFSQEPSIGEKIAQAYRVSGFGEIEELKFTFNVKKGETAASRSWVWLPKEDKVTYLGDGKTDKPVSYDRKDLSAPGSESLKEIDAHFINDQYWLLFPLHLVWDNAAKVELHPENVEFPIGGGTGRMVSVIYPPTGGYTPGDRYDLFLNDDDVIAEWIYRRGGSEIPTVTATWQDNRRMGPIVMSLNHVGADKNFRVWFTYVELKLSGSEERIKSEE
ncbi:MAG: hypothetical protein L0213_02175 [Candidatus Dadabacteria bacterium]|nr:hypothetical protein [Candidatus Dadabacteria bacterium]